MQQKTSTVAKEYTSAFALDNAKLSRMISILSERFSDVGLQMNANYVVHLANEKKIEITSLEQLLRLDNTIKNPIRSLEIRATSSSPEHEVKSSISYSDRVSDNINVSVESDDANLALKLFAELEEQVERTFLNSWVYRLLQGKFIRVYVPLLTAVLMALVLILFVPSGRRTNGISSLTVLSAQSADELLLLAEQATTTEKKLDFLFNYQLEELKLQTESRPAVLDIRDILTVRSVFIALPLLLMVGCAIYALANCYPRATFEWGDIKERYAHLISARNTLWTVVILSMVLGVLANLFVIGISGLINIGR